MRKVNVENYKGLIPLHCAAGRGNAVAVKHLLRIDAKNVNALDKEGKTPLYHACRKNVGLEVVEILFAHGAVVCVNTQNKSGNTPLHEAVRSGNLPIVKFLLLNNANVHLLNNQGDSPLHVAMRLRGYPCAEITDALLQYGAVDLIDVLNNPSSGEKEKPIEKAKPYIRKMLEKALAQHILGDAFQPMCQISL